MGEEFRIELSRFREEDVEVGIRGEVLRSDLSRWNEEVVHDNAKQGGGEVLLMVTIGKERGGELVGEIDLESQHKEGHKT